MLQKGMSFRVTRQELAATRRCSKLPCNMPCIPRQFPPPPKYAIVIFSCPQQSRMKFHSSGAHGCTAPQDEGACIGCKQCVWLASGTFRMEPDYGRSRVYAQWANTEAELEVDSQTVSITSLPRLIWAVFFRDDESFASASIELTATA